MIVDRDKALEMIEDNPENFKMCSSEIKDDPNFFDQGNGCFWKRVQLLRE